MAKKVYQVGEKVDMLVDNCIVYRDLTFVIETPSYLYFTYVFKGKKMSLGILKSLYCIMTDNDPIITNN